MNTETAVRSNLFAILLSTIGVDAPVASEITLDESSVEQYSIGDVIPS